MTYHLDDTIAAIATAPGGAARGMVRVSGPNVVAVIGRCFVADGDGPLGDVRRAACVDGRAIIERSTSPPAPFCQAGELLVPCDLFLWPTEHSYTRQPVAELHTIGSPYVLNSVLAAVCVAGARLAEPGEFTLRAFLAGRIDLTQAEAVLGVIDACGQDELTASLEQLAGGLSRPLGQLREELLQLLAELEAGLDFVEEDMRFISTPELSDRLETSADRLKTVSEQIASRLTSTQTDQVVLVGPPNVGKSSLFNALIERFGLRCGESVRSHHAALVSPIRGTTRDYLTAIIILDGIRCDLVDTAGIDEVVSASLEAAAQSLRRERQEAATIRVHCSDESELGEPPAGCDLFVLTKSDKVRCASKTPRGSSAGVPTISTSSSTGEGLDELGRELRMLLARDSTSQKGAVVAATAERCRESVRLAVIALERAVRLVRDVGGDELVAEEVRAAVGELGKVVGTVYTDDILDRIFSTFCVGK